MEKVIAGVVHQKYEKAARVTFIPSSHEIQRSPLVRKQATACLAK